MNKQFEPVGGRQDPSEIGVNQTKEIHRHTFSHKIGGGAMGATRRLLTYKCEKGHVMKKTFSLGTRFDDVDETTCAECLAVSEVKKAYLIFAEDTSAGKK